MGLKNIAGALTRSAASDGDDPYQYQRGFGNHHVSEAVPGSLPRHGTNMPQKCPFDLFPEHLNGTSFISSRESVANV
jgi:homogentisate 1,2-dioxygenase